MFELTYHVLLQIFSISDFVNSGEDGQVRCEEQIVEQFQVTSLPLLLQKWRSVNRSVVAGPPIYPSFAPVVVRRFCFDSAS